MHHPLRWLVIVALLMEICYGSFYAVPAGPGEVPWLIAVSIVAYLLLGLYFWRMHGTKRGGRVENRHVLLIIAIGIVFRLTLVPHSVVGSDDIYRYVWDGKVFASGISPFTYLPADPRLAHLATADLPRLVNHPELRTVYPAFAQVLFCLSSLMFGDSTVGLKLLLVLLDSCTLIVLYVFLGRRRRERFPVVLYAWSPLPVLYFGLDGHVDALGITFLVIALYFLSTNRNMRGVVALGLSALAKFVPLVVVPLTVKHLEGRRRWLLSAVPVVMTAIGFLLYLTPAGGGADALRTFGERWEFNGSIFSVVYFLTGSNDAAHMISILLIALYVAVLALVNRPLLEKVFWAFFGVILLSPVVHPWYLTWLAALLVLRWSISAFVLLGLSTIANVVVYQYQAYGQWVDQPILLLIEYVPVVALLVRELSRGEFLRNEREDIAR